MIARLVLLGAVSVALLGCEPVETTSDGEDATATVAGDTSRPDGLTASEREAWQFYTPEARAKINACMATGKSFKACGG